MRRPQSADLVQAARDALAPAEEQTSEAAVRIARKAVEPSAPAEPPPAPRTVSYPTTERLAASTDLVREARDAFGAGTEPAGEAAVRTAKQALQAPAESTPIRGSSFGDSAATDTSADPWARSTARGGLVTTGPGRRRSFSTRPRRSQPPELVVDRRGAGPRVVGMLALIGASIAVVSGLLFEDDPASTGSAAVTTVTEPTTTVTEPTTTVTQPITTTLAATTTQPPATTGAPAGTTWQVVNPEDLTLAGSASIIEAGVRLTDELDRLQAGAAWLPSKRPVADGFTTTFAFELTNRRANPGDGLAFVIHNWSGTSLPADAVASGNGYKGLRNSVAVEFDTTYHSYEGDLFASHIAVHTEGLNPNTTHRDALVGWAVPNGVQWYDQTHIVRIDYLPGSLSVFLDDMADPVLEVDIDLATTISLDDGAAWLGFTASTEGGFTDAHDILGWSFEAIGTG